jgi:hypothetical protein
MTIVTLKGLLRTTLTEVERSTELGDNDPALVELKHSLVRSVAELEVKREQGSQIDADTVPEVLTAAPVDPHQA